MDKDSQKFLLIAFLTSLVYIIPSFFIYTLSSMYETERKDLPGLTRIQPGQAIITDAEEMQSNPLLRPILVAEELNRELSIRAISSPTMAAKIKSSTLEQLKDVIVEDPEEENPEELRELLEAAVNYNLNWNPTGSPWGLFLGPGESDPIEGGLPFGAVSFAYGAEKTRYDTEKRLNGLIFLLEESELLPKKSLAQATEPLTELLTLSYQYGEMEKEEISPLVAASQALNIKYLPEKNLFLSNQTINEIKPWSDKSLLRKPLTASPTASPPNLDGNPTTLEGEQTPPEENIPPNP